MRLLWASFSPATEAVQCLCTLDANAKLRIQKLLQTVSRVHVSSLRVPVALVFSRDFCFGLKEVSGTFELEILWQPDSEVEYSA